MHRRALIVLTLVLPSVLAGQSPPTPELPNAVMLQFIRFAVIFGSRLVAAFDSIPTARYDYRPTPSQQTIGYIAQHLENANYSLCERLGVLKHPRTPKDSMSDTIKAQWPKDTLVERLEASLRFCDTGHGARGETRVAGACEDLARVRDRFGTALQSDLELHATARHGASFGAAAEGARGDRVAGIGVVTIRRRLRARVRPGARRHAAERGAPYQVEHRRRPGATLAREQQRLLRQGRGRTSHLCSRCEWSGIRPRPPPVWPRPAGEETSIVRLRCGLGTTPHAARLANGEPTCSRTVAIWCLGGHLFPYGNKRSRGVQC